MMFKEIITFYSQNPKKYVNTVCEQNDKLLDMKASDVSGHQYPSKSIESCVKLLTYNQVQPCGLIML